MVIEGRFLGVQEFRSDKMSQAIRTMSLEGLKVTVPEGLVVRESAGTLLRVEVAQTVDYRGKLEFLALGVQALPVAVNGAGPK